MSSRFGRLVPILLLAPLACAANVPAAGAQTAPKAASSEAPLIASELSDGVKMASAIRAHYTKYEYRIPMRDGVHLYTVAYVPKERAHAYPVMFYRTPYGVGPYGVDNYPKADDARGLSRFAPSRHFIEKGTIFVHQDVRGRMMSEGAFADVRPYVPNKKAGEIDESSDAFDSIDWIVKNVPANNGRVGMWGVSYPGFYAAQAAIDAHPALRAVSPQAPVSDWFVGDDFHHNGAFFLIDAFDFFSSFGKVRPEPTPKATWGFDYGTGDLYDFFLRLGPLPTANTQYFKGEIPFWNDLMEHGTKDAYWKARDPLPHYKNIKPAMLTVGGWFDAEDLFGTLETYRSIERQSPGAQNTLVMGPWKHGGWARTDGDSLGNVTFGAKTSFYYRDKIEAPFFDRYLRGEGAKAPAEAVVFETGTNTWQTFGVWPPKEAKPTMLWFQAGGKLASGSAAGDSSSEPFDSYVSDPKRPVPYTDALSTDRGFSFMTDDQRFASRRPDVLTYETAVLTEDMTLAGPIDAALWVSTTGTDADFIVKVIDVYPDSAIDPEPSSSGVPLAGYQQLVRAEVLRGKFRSSFEQPEPFAPGEPTQIRFRLPDVFHTFRPGHRLMVQVQSSWFPLVDRNPQTFVDIYKAKASDFQAATHRVYRGADKPSGIEVRLLRGSLPPQP